MKEIGESFSNLNMGNPTNNQNIPINQVTEIPQNVQVDQTIPSNQQIVYTQGLPTTQHINQAAIPAQAAPNKTGLYLALGLVGILLVTAIVLFSVFLSKKNKNKDKNRNYPLPSVDNDTTTITTPTTTTPIIANNTAQNLTVVINGTNVTYIAKNIINESRVIEGGNFNSSNYGETIFLVTNGTLKLKNVKLNKTGEYLIPRKLMSTITQIDDNTLYGVNSAIAVVHEGRLEIEESEIYTDSYGANGVHVIEGGYAEIVGTYIYSVHDFSRGIYSTFNGSIYSESSQIITEGDFSECIGTGANSGIINCTYMGLETSSSSSPLIYSTGTVEISNSLGNAKQSSIAIIEVIEEVNEYNNRYYQDSCNFIAGPIGTNNEDQCGYLIYQTDSFETNNDEENNATYSYSDYIFSISDSTSSFEDNSSAYKDATMLCVKNTNAQIFINNSDFSYGSGQFLNVSKTGVWGDYNENDLEVDLYVTNNEGNLGTLTTDNTSSINFYHDTTVSSDDYNEDGNVYTEPLDQLDNYEEEIEGKNIIYSSVNNILLSDQTLESGEYSSEVPEGIIFIVPNGVTLTLNNIELKKTCDNRRRRMASSETVIDDQNYYGTNSAIVVLKGGKAILNGVKINTNCYYSNGISAVNGGEIEIKNSVINTEGEESRGLHATCNGIINAENVTISTKGTKSESIGINHSGGTISGTKLTLNTEEEESPLLLSTGTLTLNNSTGTATKSRIAFLNGNSNVQLNNCQLNAAGIKNSQDMEDSGIYIQDSSNAGSGKFGASDSTLSITSSSDVYSTAPMFFITDTTPEITFDNSKPELGSGIFLNATGTESWSNTNYNDDLVNLKVNGKTTLGKIYANNYLPVSFTHNSEVTDDDYSIEGNVTVTSED